MQIKKSSFFLNKAFNENNTLPMQNYLNEMSAKGYHIDKIGKVSCIFTEDATVSYLYSVCSVGKELLYTNESGWTHFCNYKNVMFYRKAVPSDAVKIQRTFKKNQQELERGWLAARLAEGLALIGRRGSEYVFQRTEEFSEYEYQIIRIKKQKKTVGKDGKPLPSPFEAARGLLYLCESEDGVTYYFLKDESARHAVTKNRGKRISDQLLAMFISTASAIAFCAAVILTFVALIKNVALGQAWIALTIIGTVSSLTFFLLFIAFFNRFQKIAEARRIRKEEKRALAAKAAALQQEAAETPEKKPASDAKGNTVVMNTVVLNNYGKDGKKGSSFEPLTNSVGQIFEENPELETLNPAFASMKETNELANKAINDTLYVDRSDTLIQGEPAPEKKAAHSPLNVTYEAIAVTEEADEDEEYNVPTSFPFLFFIGCAVLSFISVAAFIFSLRFGILWLISSPKSDFLLLAISLLCIAFTPLTFKYGIKKCIHLLKQGGKENFEN